MAARPRVGRAQKVGEHSLYWVALVVSRSIGFVTVPVYARILGPGDFGRYELLSSLLLLLYSIFTLGMEFSLSVRYFRTTAGQRRADLASAMGATVGASVVAAVLMTVFAANLSGGVLESGSAVPAVVATAVALPFNVLGGIQAMAFRLQFRVRAFSFATVVGVVVGAAVGIALVTFGHAGLDGAAIGLASSCVLSAMIGFRLLRGSFGRVDLSWRNTVAMARLGLPMVPAGVAVWVCALSDRLFVSAFVGFDQLGMYAAAARIATILAVAQGGFDLAWRPLALLWGEWPDRADRYRWSTLAVAKVGGAGVVLIGALGRPLLSLIAGRAYEPASSVVWLLAASVLFYALFYVVTIGLNLAHRSGPLSLATGAAAVLNTVLNVALIPWIGYVGAGVATLAAYVGAAIAGYALSQRALPMRIGFWRAMTWSAGATAAAAASALMPGILGLPIGLVAIVVLLGRALSDIRAIRSLRSAQTGATA